MLELILGVLIVALDLASKIVCADWLTTLPGNTYQLIPNIFHLTYVENRGAAFGMLQNARWFFLAATALVVAGIIFWLIKDRKRMHTLLRICLTLIAAGALGNFIDRLALGYVRDMFYFVLIDFAVFNVADAALTVGTAILVLDLLFGKSQKYFSDDKKKRKDGPQAGPEDAP